MKHILLLFIAALTLMVEPASACTLASTSGTVGALPPSSAGQNPPGYIISLVGNGTSVIQVTYRTTGGTTTTVPISLGTSSGITVTGSALNLGRITSISGTGSTLSFNNGAGVLTFTGATVSGSGSWGGVNGGVGQVTGNGTTLSFAGYSNNTGNVSAFVPVTGTCSVVNSVTLGGIGNTGTVSTTAADATQVEYIVDGVSVGIDNSPPFSQTFGPLANGSHTITSKATFANGLVSAGGTTSISVVIDTRDGTTCAVVNGGAWCWGRGTSGQLGNGANASSDVPVAVSGLSSGVTDLTVLSGSVCAVHNGAVKCWGSNANGVLGVSSASLASSNVPVAISAYPTGTVAVALDGGTSHVCALKTNIVKCWGLGTSGQLGGGSFVSSFTPVTAVSANGFAVKAGDFHTCAIVTTGAKCWGSNSSGQIGNNSATASFATAQQVSGLTSGVTSLSSGASHSCAVASNVAKCWGNNANGALGTGSTTPAISKVPVNVVGLPSTAKVMVGGSLATCSILTTGAFYCWGDNSAGQMGQNTTSPSSLVPVAPIGMTAPVFSAAGGPLNFCAVKSNHLYCWGDNSFDQIGDPAAGNPILVPTQVLGM